MQEKPQNDVLRHGHCMTGHAARNIHIQLVCCHMTHCFDAQLESLDDACVAQSCLNSGSQASTASVSGSDWARWRKDLAH